MTFLLGGRSVDIQEGNMNDSEVKLSLEATAGSIGLMIFDNAEARFTLELCSSHVRFSRSMFAPQAVNVQSVWCFCAICCSYCHSAWI